MYVSLPNVIIVSVEDSIKGSKMRSAWNHSIYSFNYFEKYATTKFNLCTYVTHGKESRVECESVAYFKRNNGFVIQKINIVEHHMKIDFTFLFVYLFLINDFYKFLI